MIDFDTPKTAIDFDNIGFIPSVNDSLEDLQARWQWASNFKSNIIQKIDTDGEFKLLDLRYDADMVVSDQQLEDCQQPIIQSYKCQTPWVPAFFCNKGLSFIFGGMALGFTDTDGLIQKDADFSLFQLRECFKTKEKFLIYTRTEIIAHESCHIARMALNSQKYEELLAYKISSSGFRRAWGSIIRTPIDVLLFFVTVLVCLGSQVLDVLYPTNTIISIGLKLPLVLFVIFLIIANVKLHKQFKKAKSKLNGYFGKNSDAVLFRLDDDEIDSLSTQDWPSVSENISDLRMEIINTFKNEEQNDI